MGLQFYVENTVIIEWVQKIHSRGIYQSLPVYPDNVVGLTATVTGATGILGDHMALLIAKNLSRFSRNLQI